MCVSMGPAEFSGTILYCGRRRHPGHGLVEVLGYQNTAVNRAAGPNAMLLHLPAVSVTPGQFLPAGRDGSVLRDMVQAVLPAIDSHTGTIPDLGADVMTDHWLLSGSDDAPDDWGEPVDYDSEPRGELLDFLPSRVVGLQVCEPLPNGDFAIAHDDLLEGRLDHIERLVPA